METQDSDNETKTTFKDLGAGSSAFIEDGLVKKLADLNMSTQSIQTLSLWFIHHKKHARAAVHVWYKEMTKASNSRKLVFMYLANDVIQNSKRKGPEYTKEFSQRLPKAFEHLGSCSIEDNAMKGLKRLLGVWVERGVFEAYAVKVFRKLLDKKKLDSSFEETPTKKARQETKDFTSPVIENATLQQNSVSIAEFAVSPDISPIDPPEPEELIETLQELENAATSDAVIREKIASLPDRISDTSSFSKLKDKDDGNKLNSEVDDALKMLDAYNKLLSEEMDSRKKLARMLHDYIAHQKDLLAQSEETLEEHRQKLGVVRKVRKELKDHLQNLPDISTLPSIHTGGLAPLPSAGDLFI